MNDIERAILELGVQMGHEDRVITNVSCDLAISALEKLSDKNCSKCVDRNRCAIHNNFNINYCSDWSVEE